VQFRSRRPEDGVRNFFRNISKNLLDYRHRISEDSDGRNNFTSHLFCVCRNTNGAKLIPASFPFTQT
jgi:hypothetical protein